MLNKVSDIKNAPLRKLACIPYALVILAAWIFCLVVTVLIELCDLFEKAIKNTIQEGGELTKVFALAIKRAWVGDSTPINITFLVE